LGHGFFGRARDGDQRRHRSRVQLDLV
jgi:hypothetical protein